MGEIAKLTEGIGRPSQTLSNIWLAGHLPDHDFSLTLADCLRFLEALGAVSVPMPLSVLRLDLWRATEGLLTALDQLGARDSRHTL